VTSLGVGAILREFGVRAGRITELDWTESATVKARRRGEVRDYGPAVAAFFGAEPVEPV
jgi:hypothetical protein